MQSDQAWNTQSDLKDGVFIVTGSTQGIGEMIARRLAERQAAGIVIVGRDHARGVAVENDIRGLGAEAVFVEADHSNISDCRRVVQTADGTFGRIDGLVNAAGDTSRGTLDGTSEEDWDRIFAVNVRAPFFLIQETVRVMKREKCPGRIVNIITMSSHGGQPKLVPYSTSKGALSVMTKNLAHGLLQDRIRVNGVNIGWADTPNEHAVQLSEGQPENWLEAAEAAQPFGRLIKPDDVARLVLFLLSADSGLMTGSILDYDQMVMGAYD